MITEQTATHLIEMLKMARKRPRDPVVLSYFDLVDLAEFLVHERERIATANQEGKTR